MYLRPILSIYAHIFVTGKVPRCVRNALPSPMRIFHDSQRQVGIPLLIQNANSGGGLVIGAFNIVGAVLENDLDNFRFLSTEELTWPEFIDKELFNISGPVHKITDRRVLDHLTIRSKISLWDISEYNQDNNRESLKYVVFRYSDKRLFLADGSGNDLKTSIVPLSLSEMFDFEIFSFARVIYWPEIGDTWIAVIGCIDMYNAGGSINSIQFEQLSEHQRPRLSLRVLGPGRYWMVYSPTSIDSGRSLEVTSNAMLSHVSSLEVQVTHMTDDGLSTMKEAKVLEFAIDCLNDEDIAVFISFE